MEFMQRVYVAGPRHSGKGVMSQILHDSPDIDAAVIVDYPAMPPDDAPVFVMYRNSYAVLASLEREPMTHAAAVQYLDDEAAEVYPPHEPVHYSALIADAAAVIRRAADVLEIPPWPTAVNVYDGDA